MRFTLHFRALRRDGSCKAGGVGKYLSTLAKANLVSSERCGQKIRYRLKQEQHCEAGAFP